MGTGYWCNLIPFFKRGFLDFNLRLAIRCSRGFDSFRNPVVHGLGLEHTDDPKSIGTQPGVKISQSLEKNMIINIDMPFTEIGWGSVHMEDTILITDDGFERLSTADFSLRSS